MPEMDDELRRLGLAHCQAVLDSLGPADLVEATLGPGPSDECGAEAGERHELGAFALCRWCRRRRKRAEREQVIL